MESIEQKTPQCCGLLEQIQKTQSGKREVLSRPITYGDTPVNLILLPWVLNAGGCRYLLNYCPFCGERISERKVESDDTQS